MLLGTKFCFNRELASWYSAEMSTAGVKMKLEAFHLESITLLLSYIPPADQQFRMVKNINFTTDGQKIVGTLKIASLFVNCDDLHGYEVLARKLGGERQLYEAGRWTSDVKFGRQMMNGISPIIIERCRAVPPNFHVTNEMVQPFLSLSLERYVN